MLVADPARTATSLFTERRQRYADRFTDGQCRTLQRRVQEWRAQGIVVLDAQWLERETAQMRQMISFDSDDPS